MVAGIVCGIVGLICVVIGITNMRGNISSLHSYHTHRVAEEDKPAFGKLVGLGTIIAGVAVALYGVLISTTILTGVNEYSIVGVVLLIAGIVAGMGVAFYAMIKYNKGIF